MANIPVILVGILFLVISGIGFAYPVNEDGHPIVQAHKICSSSLGQLEQFFEGQSAEESCEQIKLISYGVYGFGLIGIFFVIVGAVISRTPEIYYQREVEDDNKQETSLEILKQRYANGEITKEEFDEIKEHLDDENS
jgi:putative membrane protein